ncbi:unnamed protein product [Arctogadus glacialis]
MVPRLLKDLGIHGQALLKTIRSVSEAAERSSQWIWIKRKDAGLIEQQHDMLTYPHNTPHVTLNIKANSCVSINTIYWHNGQLTSRPVLNYSLIVRCWWPCNVLLRRAASSEPSKGHNGPAERLLKDLGIHGQALLKTIRSVSEAAERSSQWIWIKRKDAGLIEQQHDMLTYPHNTPHVTLNIKANSCVSINTIYWHNGQLTSRPVLNYSLIVRCWWPCNVLLRRAASSEPSKGHNGPAERFGLPWNASSSAG